MKFLRIGKYTSLTYYLGLAEYDARLSRYADIFSMDDAEDMNEFAKEFARLSELESHKYLLSSDYYGGFESYEEFYEVIEIPLASELKACRLNACKDFKAFLETFYKFRYGCYVLGFPEDYAEYIEAFRESSMHDGWDAVASPSDVMDIARLDICNYFKKDLALRFIDAEEKGKALERFREFYEPDTSIEYLTEVFQSYWTYLSFVDALADYLVNLSGFEATKSELIDAVILDCWKWW